MSSDSRTGAGLPTAREVEISAGPVRLPGSLILPANAAGLVAFAHGSGSSRFSPRNTYVAAVLHDVRLGTLLFDLLTPEEELDRRNVFDVALLAQRLLAATTWLDADPELARLPLGYFGASTGAAAALCAAAGRPRAAAVVSRGGRPDLAGPWLHDVQAPTLLIVGALDDVVLALNEGARDVLPAAELAIVPGATHLFEEPGALDRVSTLARDWYARHLTGTG